MRIKFKVNMYKTLYFMYNCKMHSSHILHNGNTSFYNAFMTSLMNCVQNWI